jgi:hypothetical protein
MSDGMLELPHGVGEYVRVEDYERMRAKVVMTERYEWPAAVKALNDMCHHTDNEATHHEADEILLAVLRGAGIDEVADAWERLRDTLPGGLWYA